MTLNFNSYRYEVQLTDKQESQRYNIYFVSLFIIIFFREENEQKLRVYGLLEGSVPHPKIIGGVPTPATPPVAEPLADVTVDAVEPAMRSVRLKVVGC